MEPLRSPLKILIVDDHPLVRKGFSALISQADDLVIVGESDDVDDALQQVGELRPDLVIVDLSLKTGNGLDLIKQLSQKFPHVKKLVCSIHGESLYAERCLRAGASGYLNKQLAGETVLEAIRTVQDGKTYLSPRLAEILLGRMVGSNSASQASSIESLTDRELEVFGLIGQALTTRQISERLQLSYKTIESYRENIKAKLSLKNAAELNQHAVRWILENS